MRTEWIEAARPRVLTHAARSAAFLLCIGAGVIALECSVVPTPNFPDDYRWVHWVVSAPRKSELLRAADAAMYRAKGAGRNRVVAAA